VVPDAGLCDASGARLSIRGVHCPGRRTRRTVNDLGLDLVDACWPWLREPGLLGHKFGVVKGSRSATLLVAHATQHAEADSFLGILSSSPGALVAELEHGRASGAAISEAVCCASGST